MGELQQAGFRGRIIDPSELGSGQTLTVDSRLTTASFEVERVAMPFASIVIHQVATERGYGSAKKSEAAEELEDSEIDRDLMREIAEQQGVDVEVLIRQYYRNDRIRRHVGNIGQDSE